MGQVGSKMRRVGPSDGHGGGLAHWCPACDCMHMFTIDGKNSSGAQWKWDGNVENPTFAPSMFIRSGKYVDPTFEDDDGLSAVCHYFLQNGAIQYLSDCTHALKSQRIVLPPLPEHFRDE